MNPKEVIQNLLAASQLDEAFRQLIYQLPSGSSLCGEASILQSQFGNLQSQKALGLISVQDEQLIYNRIVYGLNDLLNRWHPGGNLSALQRAVERLDIDPDAEIGAMHLVNCDREAGVKKFRKVFNKKRNACQAFQFYFIAACRSEMPDSFSKRLIYQIIEEELGGEAGAINYPFREESGNHIKIEKIPLGSDLESSRKKFKQYVARRFQFADTQSFEAFIETGVPKLPYQYVTAVFDLSEKEWEGDEGEIRDYLQWMIDTFRCPHPDVPTFLFFFVVYARNLYDEAKRTPRQQEILTELESLCQQNDTALFTELLPVEATDFEDWLNELDVRNPNQTHDLVKALAQSLEPSERQMFEANNTLHMKDIEPVQKMIYNIANS